MSSKRALVCALMPEVDRDSGSRRVSHLIDLLRQSGWTVTFVSHHAKSGRRYVDVLQQRGVAVYQGASEHVPSLIASGIFDLALFGLWHIAEPFLPSIRQDAPRTRIIVDSVDLHFLRNARRLLSERNGEGSAAALDGTYASELVREINTYDAADAVLTVSEKEAALVNDFLGKRSAFAVPDYEVLEPSSIDLSSRKGIVMIGCYRHRPNADAVAFLCQEIVPLLDPRLLARHPIQIVGDGLTPEVRRHASISPHVRIVGWVPAIFPYLERARLTVLPLRYGAGTKRKLLQTLAIGTPAVSTSIGTEGFELVDRKHVLVADDPAAFADAISELSRDDRLWKRLARHGRSHIAGRHSEDVARSQLLSVVDTVLAAAPRPISRPTQAVRGYYAELVSRVRDTVIRTIPVDATVAVVSKGDDTLLRLEERRAWHFPHADNGEYAGWYPADDDDAIAQVRGIIARGAQYLVFPATAAWWLTHYARLRAYLDRIGHAIVSEPDVCVIYALGHEEPVVAPKYRPKPSVSTARSDVGVGRDLGREQRPRKSLEPAVRLIAFLLPQFHPIPENDLWWGKGFSEWTNVVRAKPLFPGHYQPRLPADLGFYDLRLSETREMQAKLARAHGIHGFCYYHYWFGGRMLLERPFNEVLQSGRPDFPFCLCWANEPWARRWDGRPKDVLQPQAYSLEDDRRHIAWLIPALSDPRAIRIEGKPIFLVYQGKELPNPQRTIEIWRTEVERAGLPGVYLIAVESGWDAGWDATRAGFDAKVLFQPQFSMLRTVPRSSASAGGLQVYDYDAAWPILANPEPVRYRRYSTVFPSWDNSARQGATGVVVHNATPTAYEAWLRDTIAHALRESAEHRVVFINAWNEWAEGCYLEPDIKYGRSFLEATARAVRAAQPSDLELTTATAEMANAKHQAAEAGRAASSGGARARSRRQPRQRRSAQRGLRW